MNDVFRPLINLAVHVLVAWLVWRYYRKSVYPVSERYSTFGPRFWTGSVDACILWPVSFVAAGLLTLGLPTLVAAVLIIAKNLVWLFYTIVMHAKYGQTYGKMVCKVRVVDFKTEGALSSRQHCSAKEFPWL
jgi:uncharacterized RDD family membrane protein YckC